MFETFSSYKFLKVVDRILDRVVSTSRLRELITYFFLYWEETSLSLYCHGSFSVTVSKDRGDREPLSVSCVGRVVWSRTEGC